MQTHCLTPTVPSGFKLVNFQWESKNWTSGEMRDFFLPKYFTKLIKPPEKFSLKWHFLNLKTMIIEKTVVIVELGEYQP